MKKCIYALDAGGSFLKCGLVDENLSVICGTHDSEPADSANGTEKSIRGAYKALAARAKARAASAGYEIYAIGMDTPGPFDYATGTFRMTHKYSALYGVSVLPWFAEDFSGVPVNIMHDSTAFILGVSKDLPEEKKNGLAVVMLGTGLGFAVMKNGKPLLAANGGPGVSIYRASLHGVEAEELISARGICERYATAVGCGDNMPDARQIAELAKYGDRYAITTYADTGRLLGELLSPILAEYGIHTLMLGGQISRDCGLFMPQLRIALEHSACGFRGEILEAPHADDAHLIGAATGCEKIISACNRV